MKTYDRRRSTTQERRVAADVGGRVQVASGATPFAKGDVRRVGDIKVECKTTGARSYSLKLAEVQKIQAEALTQGAEDWVMQIEFQGAMGNNKKVAVIDWNTFLELREKAGMDR